MFVKVGAWIAGGWSKFGAALLTWGGIALGVLLALSNMKRRERRRGRDEVRSEEEIKRLQQAARDGEKHAEITEAMQDADASGPRTRDDVLERLRAPDDR